MSPRRPHLRDRKKIKAPRRFDDTSVIPFSSSRQESHEESEVTSGIEEEIYKPLKPRRPKSKAYHGNVVEFNPNLPPAAFPTLDHPDYVHNGGNIPINVEPQLSRSQSQDISPADSEAITPDSEGRGCDSEEIDVIGKHPAMTSATADSTRCGSQSVKRTSTHEQQRSKASMPSSTHGEPTDNGPWNPIWASNMSRMEEAGRMSELERNILDMETSLEEDVAARPTKFARIAGSLDFPAWDDLTVAHKLDLADAIGAPDSDLTDAFAVTNQLRLSVPQQEELDELLAERQNRAAMEEAHQQRLLEQTKDVLLQGGHLSQSAFHQMVDENLYGTISENNPLQTNLKELKKARAYLRHCGLDPALADQNWDVSSILSAPKNIEPRRAPKKAKASLSTTTFHTSSIRPETSSSRQPPIHNVPHQISQSPDPCLRPSQQYRPNHAHALIAQHFPAALLSKVPIQAYRVASSVQDGALRSKCEVTARIPQPALPVSSKEPSASIDSDLPAINNTLMKAHGATAVLPTTQEACSSPPGTYSCAPEDLPTSRKNQASHCSGESNVGASASQGSDSFVEHAESVNQKKRKRVAS